LDVEGLAERSERLLSHMRDVGYSEGYVDQVAREVRWLARNGGRYKDFGEACAAREAESGSEVTRKSRRVSMGIVAAFETSGELPEFGRSSPLRSRSSYSRLLPGMAGVVDAYLSHARAAGVSDGTAAHYASVASSFLLDMQFRGRGSLAEVTEADVLDRFTDDDGGPAVSQATSLQLVAVLEAVLEADLGPLSAEAGRVAAYVPRVCARHRVIDYLSPDEVSAIRSALSDATNGLRLRDRAMVTVLLQTGLRSSDVCDLELGDVDFERRR